MKANSKYIFIALLLFAFSFTLSAQTSRFGMTYNTGLPLGESAELTKPFSWRGAGMEGRWDVGSDFYLGFSSSWSTFYESRSGTFTKDTRTVTGTQYRYLNVLPQMFTAFKHFESSGTVTPYIGTGVGATYAIQEIQMGLWLVDEYNWHFGLAPEVGILFNGYSTTSFMLSVRYNYAFKVSDAPAVSFLNFNIGFLF